jgi:hypothetical protein
LCKTETKQKVIHPGIIISIKSKYCWVNWLKPVKRKSQLRNYLKLESKEFFGISKICAILKNFLNFGKNFEVFIETENALGHFVNLTFSQTTKNLC